MLYVGPVGGRGAALPGDLWRWAALWCVLYLHKAAMRVFVPHRWLFLTVCCGGEVNDPGGGDSRQIRFPLLRGQFILLFTRVPRNLCLSVFFFSTLL